MVILSLCFFNFFVLYIYIGRYVQHFVRCYLHSSVISFYLVLITLKM
uniref:Uncharacterized protein n=1 Tax=Arundo donax TaxID=35708 RepID=A0A0A9GWN0_ARUDO